MKRMFALCNVSLVAAALLFAAGCASDSAEKSSKGKSDSNPNHQTVTQPSKVKFSEFKSFEIKPFTIANAKQAKDKGNRKSQQVMDGILQRELANVLPNLKVLAPGEDFSKTADRTLQITPVIKDIDIQSVGTRVWVGVMAGGSDLTVVVTYQDSSTGEAIATPQFWRGINAWSGSTGWGAGDNSLRDAVCKDIVDYTQQNK
ncbi:MAG TPA: hypothetical protein VMV72_08145 [Verrucomicrobiae bacterium]|nr:hypothetical protein [Verrucomicrobiae bacterium]